MFAFEINAIFKEIQSPIYSVGILFSTDIKKIIQEMHPNNEEILLILQ